MYKRNELPDIKAIFLCGGIGKRMFPISTDKSLLKFNGIPLIVHQVVNAKRAGIRSFIIVGNYNNINELQSVLTKIPQITLDFVVQSNAYGMANAILECSAKINNKPILIVSSNDVIESSAYSRIINSWDEFHDTSSFITARIVKNYFPGGYLITNAEGNIKRIVEKPDRGNEPSNLINIVLHLHTRPDLLISCLLKTKSEKDDVYEKTLNIMIKNKYKMKAVIYKNNWHTIKYPWHILEVMEYFLKRIKGTKTNNAYISTKATISGNVYIEDGAKVLEGAVIRGPSYIGSNSIIGNNSLIRNSYIGNNCVIGFNTEIKHSYVNDRCWFHSNYIGDSVLDYNCSFGAGSITANFRLDESNILSEVNNNRINTGTDKLGVLMGPNCRVGVNASIMPGIRVGSNSIIGPHLNIKTDIGENKTAKSNTKYVIVANIKKNTDKKRKALQKRII